MRIIVMDIDDFIFGNEEWAMKNGIRAKDNRTL